MLRVLTQHLIVKKILKIRIRKSKDRQHIGQQKDRQHIGQQDRQHIGQQKDRQHIGQQKDRQHIGQEKDRQHLGQKKDRQHIGQQDRQHIGQKKDRQHIGQKKKDKKTSSNLQNTTQKIKDRVARTPLKIGSEQMCSGRVGSSCSSCGTRRATLVTNPVISHE